jgi:hypothetical protein
MCLPTPLGRCLASTPGPGRHPAERPRGNGPDTRRGRSGMFADKSPGGPTCGRSSGSGRTFTEAETPRSVLGPHPRDALSGCQPRHRQSKHGCAASASPVRALSGAPHRAPSARRKMGAPCAPPRRRAHLDYPPDRVRRGGVARVPWLGSSHASKSSSAKTARTNDSANAVAIQMLSLRNTSSP